MANRHADLADLAARKLVIAVIAGLSRQIESDRKAGLAFLQIHPVERVGGGRGAMARIGADQPRPVALARAIAPVKFTALLHLRNRRPLRSRCAAQIAGPPRSLSLITLPEIPKNIVVISISGIDSGPCNRNII